jgi:hypothetical protein
MTDHSDGIEDLNKLKAQYCLNVARSSDAQAARMRNDSCLRKLISEQAAKYGPAPHDMPSPQISPTFRPANVRQRRVP